MQSRFASFLICCFLLLSISGNAQILDRLTRSIDSALDNEVGKISDKLAEKFAEKIFKKLFEGEQVSTDSLKQVSTDTTKSVANSDFASIFSSKPKKVDKSFSFDYRIKMAVGQGDKINTYDYLLPQTGTYSAMLINDMVVITDFDSGDSYTIIDGKLMSFNMTKIVEKYVVKSIDTNQEEVTITKTGRSEMIAGYKADEYNVKSKDADTDVWITNDFINLDLQSAAMIKMLQKENPTTIQNTGYAMKIIMRKAGEKDSIIEVKSVTKESKTYDLSQF